MTDLHGAVADADAVEQYLRNDLKVPANHITCLRDDQASRKGIIAAFKALKTDKRIRRDNPILVYYAGHGGELVLEDTETVQSIIPQDYRPGIVRPNPDRTIAALLDSFAAVHDNNITVIFDCCHSGSGTRGHEKGLEPLSRGAQTFPSDFPDDLDLDILGGRRGVHWAPGFANRGIRSHVFLAACGSTELALEDQADGQSRGRFTSALLKLLQRVGPQSLTYVDVLNQIDPIAGQNPQCEGLHRDRMFFESKVSSPRRSCFDVKIKGNVPVIQAGSIQGITYGAQFTIYLGTEAMGANASLGVYIPSKISPLTTVLKADVLGPAAIKFSSKQALVGLQTKTSDAEQLRVHIPSRKGYANLRAVVGDAIQLGGLLSPFHVSLVPRDQADLEMTIDKAYSNHIVFSLTDKRLHEHGVKQIPHRLDILHESGRLEAVLRAAAHYHTHLNHIQRNDLIEDRVHIRFNTLSVLDHDFDDDGYPIVEPSEVNLLQNGVVSLSTIEDATLYGIEVQNGTSLNLHFQCLYFDSMDFSITPLTDAKHYTGRFAKDFALPAGGGKAALGYGSLGIPPLKCTMPPGLEVVVGFLKFYFATEPIDLALVAQPSPFGDTLRGVRRQTERRSSVSGTVLVPVIQRRPRKMVLGG